MMQDEEGFNTQTETTETYGNLVQAGVIDPANVTTCA